MKKLTVYNVYLDDGKSVFRVTVPAASKKEAADYVQGNGDVVAINPAPVQGIDLHRLAYDLKSCQWSQTDIHNMTALDKKINQLAARHRWNVTPVHDRFIPCYSIVPMDRQERDRIKATLDRCKGLKVKVEQVFSPYAWTCTIYVFDLAEWNAQQERSRREWAIVNAYSEAYHFNGHDSAGAKLAAQHKAAEIGALDLFRQMYTA